MSLELPPDIELQEQVAALMEDLAVVETTAAQDTDALLARQSDRIELNTVTQSSAGGTRTETSTTAPTTKENGEPVQLVNTHVRDDSVAL